MQGRRTNIAGLLRQCVVGIVLVCTPVSLSPEHVPDLVGHAGKGETRIIVRLIIVTEFVCNAT